MKILFLFLSFTFLFSCNPEDELFIPSFDDDEVLCIVCDTTTSKLEVIWQVPLHIDTLNSISTEPIFLDDKVVFTRWADDSDDPEIITAFNGNDGSINWQIESPTNNRTGTRYGLFNYQNDLIYKAGRRDICRLNNEGGLTEWCYHPHDDNMAANTPMVIIDNHYYREHNSGGLEPEESYLIKGNLENGDIEILFSTQKIGDFSPLLATPSQWFNENNEEYLFFCNKFYDFGTVNSYTELYMYNVEDAEIEYKWEGLNISARRPYIWNDKIYTTGNDSLFCIDIHSKNVLWTKYIGQYGFSNMVIKKGVLVANPDDNRMMGLDPYTGEIVWSTNDSGATCPYMTYFDGIVYFGSLGDGKLFAVDVETGEHIWAEDTPNAKNGYPNADFLNGVAIDTINRILYTDDEYFVMAIKLPER